MCERVRLGDAAAVGVPLSGEKEEKSVPKVAEVSVFWVLEVNAFKEEQEEGGIVVVVVVWV